MAAMVAQASGGELTAAGVAALGLTSLGHIRLIDAIEDEFGVDIEFDGHLDSLDDLVGYVSDHLVMKGPS